jgi:hypothetical protein
MSIHKIITTGTAWAVISPQNVFHMNNQDGLWTPLQIAEDIRDNWCTILAAGMTNQCGFRNVTVSEIGSAAAPFNLPIVVNGIDGVDPATGGQVMQPKFRIHTPVGGRRGRGRIYLWGYRAELIDRGQLNETGITNMSIRLNALQAAYVGTGHTSHLSLGILKRGGSAADFIPADFLSLALIPGVQRRRTLGVGI